MAEAVIGSIAEKIIEILSSQAIETVGKLWGIKRELKTLKDIVSNLQCVLDDAEEQYHQLPHIRVWVEQLKDAFYEAQDVLEEFNIEAMRRELRGHNEMMKAVRTFFSSSNQLAFKLKMSDKVRGVRVRIEALDANRTPTLKEHPKKELRNREETHSFIREEDIKGREDDKERVMKFLLDSSMEENVSILPIVGIGGLGKTALAKYVYGDSKFDLKMWVCVSTNFDVKKIVKKMLACVMKQEPIEDTMELLQSNLREKIDGKKYLLVLDDVWSIEQTTWLSLKTLLVGGAKGSKILITTRISSVAKITNTTQPHFLEGLSESASLELLMQMAGRKIEEIQDSHMLAIGKEIVRKCSGVPLVIRTVGSLLLEKSKREWLDFKDYVLPEVSQRDESIISILRLSYDHLPSHLKQCFAFCSLFPKDYEMDKQILVSLWVAEGFIQSNESQHLEDIAHGYFMDLLWNNFFQDYKKDPFNTDTCKMHDLMHDLACSVAGNECLAAWDGTKSIHERTRHISYGSTFNLMGGLPISHLKASALRTFLSTTGYWKVTSEADLGQFILNFKRLHTLDLHGMEVKKVPRSIYKLKYLTYLDLSYNHTLKRLPNSITRLQSLQTLNLHQCDALEELPSDIRKLVSLRNLDISSCDNLSYLPRGIGELSSLHRLTHFILPEDKAHAKNYCGLGELNGLNNIRGRLSIENLRYVTNAEVECRDANLMGKHSLESLELHWGKFNTDGPKIANRDEASLDGLRPPSNLQELIIQNYKGERFPRWMMDSLVYSLPHLVKLHFDGCESCKRLPPLDKLPLLKSLYIGGIPELEYIGSDQSSTSTTSFPSLVALVIDGCEKLKAMPLTAHLEELDLFSANRALLINQMMLGLNKLKRLNICDIKFLECLPGEGFQSLTSLESLEIKYCHQLTSLSQGMRHLSSLVVLSIQECKELDISKDKSGNIFDFHGGLQSLRSVEIYNLPKLTSLPQWLLQACNLEHLHISQCEELDLSKDESSNIILDFHGLQSLRSVQFEGIPKLESLPQWILQLCSLERLSIWDCEELDLSKDESGNIILDFHGLQSLRSLQINGLPKLESLPQRILLLRSLEHLDISHCPNLKALSEQIEKCEELDISKDESGNILDFHGGLHSLRSVEIACLPKLTSLPQWLLQARNLEHLNIWHCHNLKDIPEQIEAFQSLQYLEIIGCDSLTSFPEAMRRLTSLTHLNIEDCGELGKSCGRQAGEDWDKIAHIPHIQSGWRIVR